MDPFDRGRLTSSGSESSRRPSGPPSLQQSRSSVDAYLRHGHLGIISRTPSPGGSLKPSPTLSYRSSSVMQNRSPSQSQERRSIIPYKPKTVRKFKWMKGDLIGKGSYGRVYYAFDTTTGETMAVKQVEQPQTPSDLLKGQIEKMVQALKEENQTLKRLNHPNIVLYKGFEENPETINIFLEYVPGGTIHSCLIKHGVFRDEVSKSFAAQILSGLHYLHSKGVIHRDLKSENILVEPEGVCKISDFGISKNILGHERKRAFTLMKGTGYWMSPEVINDEGPERRGYDEKVDIWSMGCLMHEMWTANRPWENFDNIMQVFAQLLEKLAPPLPKDLILTPDARDFINLCYQPEPSNRPGADFLLRHSYLKLPSQWIFPGMGEMGTGKRRGQNDDYRERLSKGRDTMDFAAAEELAQMMSQTIRISTVVPPERTLSPAHTMTSVADPYQRNTPPRRPSPPVVFIEPPPPRKTYPTDEGVDDWMNRNSSLVPDGSGSSQTTKPARKLMIYNPDSNDARGADPRKSSAFNFQPPPLPTDNVPYSQQLAPVSKAAVNSQHPPPIPSTSRHFTEAKASYALPGAIPPSSPRHAAHRREEKPVVPMLRFASSSDFQQNSLNLIPSPAYPSSTGSESSTNSSMWQRRPAPSIKGKEPDHTSDTPAPNHIGMGDERPPIAEVYQHMTMFFPHHNLDELVESPIRSYGGDQQESIMGRRYTMKSIRAIAQEQLDTGRLQIGKSIRHTYNPYSENWDAELEEIKEDIH